jgi:hypothetical protein
MTSIKLLVATAILSVAVASPALAWHKHRHHHHHHSDGAASTHNYGPPVWPGDSYATYDGPLSALCKQGAAAYRGQDGRRHPCH